MERELSFCVASDFSSAKVAEGFSSLPFRMPITLLTLSSIETILLLRDPSSQRKLSASSSSSSIISLPESSSPRFKRFFERPHFYPLFLPLSLVKFNFEGPRGVVFDEIEAFDLLSTPPLRSATGYDAYSLSSCSFRNAFSFLAMLLRALTSCRV